MAERQAGVGARRGGGRLWIGLGAALLLLVVLTNWGATAPFFQPIWEALAEIVFTLFGWIWDVVVFLLSPIWEALTGPFS